MSDRILSLRRHRKRLARREKDRRAARNRAREGLTKSERRADEAERARAARDLEGKRIEE